MTQKKREAQNKGKRKDLKKLLALISACNKNITSLVNEAELLFNHQFYARSFAISYSALEEEGKYLLVCDYLEDMISEEEFQAAFHDHKLKIAYLNNNCDITETESGECNFTIVYDKKKYAPWFDERNRALYIDFNDSQIFNPLEHITEDYAAQILQYAQRVVNERRKYEYISELFGSKAFYK